MIEVLKEERELLVTYTELAFLDDLTRDEIGVARGLAHRYRDLELGLADVSLIVLSRRYDARRIVTFEDRAFRSVEPLHGGSFTILPADG